MYAASPSPARKNPGRSFSVASRGMSKENGAWDKASNMERAQPSRKPVAPSKGVD